jgi:hypothetical protein
MDAGCAIAKRQRPPLALTRDRHWRWCVKRTLLDLRHGRVRSVANARRLFLRRWARSGPADDWAERARGGEEAIADRAPPRSLRVSR